MTIVIQHQFWDLKVNENAFEISLSFNNVAENLIIPFAAVQCFYDPYAAFEAAFNLPEESKKNDVSNFTELTKELEEKPNSEAKTAKIVSLSEFRQKKD